MKNLHDTIIEAWEDHLVASRTVSSSEHTTHKEKKFYVSDMGKCKRMRYLKRKGITGEYGTDMYYTFAYGDFIHKLGYKALEAKNLLVSTEQYVELEHFIGRYDGKIQNEKKVTMFDFKSTNPYIMKKIVAGGSDNIENIMQLLTYVLLDKDKNLTPSGVVIYINKLPSDKIEPTIIKPREYHLETYKDEIKEDMDIMIDAWLTNKIPKCSCPSWSIQKYNSYYLFCHMEDKEIKKYLDYIKAGKKISSDGYKINVKEKEKTI